MKKRALLASALLLTASTMCFAQSLHSLNKAQVTRELQGKTVTTISLVTLNNDLITNSFSGYFNQNGQVQGQFSVKPESDPQNDQGTWSVKSDGTLCATWQHWNKAKPICVTVYKLKNSLIFINEQTNKLETIILDDNIKAGNQIG